MGVRFARKAQVKLGKGQEAQAFAADISAHWLETYGVEVKWGIEIGGDSNTIWWFSDHASLADMEATMAASMQNEETNKLLSEASDLFRAPAQDKLIMTM